MSLVQSQQPPRPGVKRGRLRTTASSSPLDSTTSNSDSVTATTEDDEEEEEEEEEGGECDVDDDYDENEATNLIILSNRYESAKFTEKIHFNEEEEGGEENTDTAIAMIDEDDDDSDRVYDNGLTPKKFSEDDDHEGVERSLAHDGRASKGGGSDLIYVAFYSPSKMAKVPKYADKQHAERDGEKPPSCGLITRLFLGLYGFVYDMLGVVLGWFLFATNKITSLLTKSAKYPQADFSHVEICTDRYTYYIMWGGKFSRAEGRQFSKDKYGLLVVALSKKDYEHVVRCCDQAFQSGISFNYYGSVFNFLLPKRVLRFLHGKPVASSQTTTATPTSNDDIIVDCASTTTTTSPSAGEDPDDIGYRNRSKKFCSEFIAETLSGTELFAPYFRNDVVQVGDRDGRGLRRRYYSQLMSPNGLYELIGTCGADNPGRVNASYKNTKKNNNNNNNNNNNSSSKDDRNRDKGGIKTGTHHVSTPPPPTNRINNSNIAITLKTTLTGVGGGGGGGGASGIKKAVGNK